MAGEVSTPIVYNLFKGETDEEYYDIEDLDKSVLKKTTNLSSGRKVGSLVQFGGTTYFTLNGVQLSSANIPNPSGYRLIDFYSFSFDRDSVEAMVLVYQDINGNTKLYVNPWYNPTSEYSNFDRTEPTGWVHKWMELTERHSNSVNGSIASGNVLTLNSNPNKNLAGWFLWNKTKESSSSVNKYNYVTYSDGTTCSTIVDCTGYSDDDELVFYRFPVSHYYEAMLPTISDTEYSGKGNEMSFTPTHFFYGQNELRIPCGKDKRPLILQDIFRRKFFQDGQLQVTTRFLVGGTVASSDTNLTSIPTLALSGGGGSGGNLAIYSMKVGGFTITFAGSGHFLGEVLTGTCVGIIEKPEFIVTSVGANGGVTGLSLSKAGKFTSCYLGTFSLVRKFTQGGGGGIDILDFPEENDGPPTTLTLTYAVDSVVVVTPGSGYTSAPTVTPTPNVCSITALLSPVSGTNLTGLKHDGLWFDFQEIPQVLYKSIVSPFADLTYTGKSKLYIKPGVSTGILLTTDPGGDRIELEWSKLEQLTVSYEPTDPSGYREGVVYEDIYFVISLRNDNSVLVIQFVDRSSTPPLRRLMQVYYGPNHGIGWLPGLSMKVLGSDLATLNLPDDYSNINYMSANILVTGSEADSNLKTENKFLGVSTEVIALPSPAPSDIYMTPFVLTAVTDSRNEILLSQGRIWGNPPSTNNYEKAYRLKINPWFSRRLTSFKFYNSDTQSTSQNTSYEAVVVGHTEYPWFIWQKLNPNEFGLKNQLLAEEVITPINGVIPEGSKLGRKRDAGLNAYTLDPVNGVFYLKLENTYQGVADLGFGGSFVTETNRTIDQDITMNYTRITYAGEVNGRFFITGCKNTVEKVVFENDDSVLYNPFAMGISMYDTFLRSQFAITGIGSRDTNREIVYFGGFVVVVKDSGVYFLDINTEDSVKYRIVATQLGRGTTNPDSIVQTPYCVVIPVDDSVFLVNPQAPIRKLLDNTNGRLNWYKTYFAKQKMMSVYYPQYDELYLVQRATSSTDKNYILCYSFITNTWTTIEHNLESRTATTSYLKARMSQSKQVVLLNYSESASNLVKLDDLASSYINTAGSTEPIQIYVATHNLNISARVFDILVNAIVCHYDATFSSTKKLKNILNKVVGLSKSRTTSLSQGKNIRVTNLFDSNSVSDLVSVVVTNLDENDNIQALSSFSLNSFILWITKQRRQLIQS